MNGDDTNSLGSHGFEHAVVLDHHAYLIRPVCTDDESKLLAMFSRSSPEDLRLRCLGTVKDFPRLASARLTHGRAEQETALVALDREGAGEGEIVGVAHIIEDPGTEGSAEYDILVRTDRKGHGIGYQLMQDILVRARERGLAKVIGYVASENQVMLQMAAELGFRQEQREAGVVRVAALLRPA